MKISFLTTSHIPEDDRMFYHQAISLVNEGYIIEIVSSKLEKEGRDKDIFFRSFDGNKLSKKEKVAKFVERLEVSKPDTIICFEPLSIYSASLYKKRAYNQPNIIYDITEWYPSKKNLNELFFLKKIIHFFSLMFFNLAMASKADGFIFGEWYKAKPYRFLFHKKPFVYVGYYPCLGYIKHTEPRNIENSLMLSYSGKLSNEKGFGFFLDVITLLSIKRPKINIYIDIIGWYATKQEQVSFEEKIEKLPSNIKYEISPFLPYQLYLQRIKDSDIFIDLRLDDFENQYCLPIKIFYYAALKRPVIYTDLKSIRKEVEIEKFGFLVNPRNTEKITNIILKYIDNKDIYKLHCNNARKLAEEKYNWNKIKNSLIRFVQSENNK